MTAKEKAHSLVVKFYGHTISVEKAKNCALIAVNLLIEEQAMWQNGQTEPVLFWQEVKQELEKL